MHTRGQYLISTDPARINLDAVHAMLSRAYWCLGIPKPTVARALANSIPFGIYDTSKTPHAQVGIARIITDKATFAYLCDVFIEESHRGHGLSKWLVEVIIAHPDLQGLRRICLLTRDAQGLYDRYNFGPLAPTTTYMERVIRDVYKQGAAAGKPQ